MELFLQNSTTVGAPLLAALGLWFIIFGSIDQAKKEIKDNEYIKALGSIKNVYKCKLVKSNNTAKVIVKNICFVDLDILEDILKRHSGNELIFSYGSDEKLKKLFVNLRRAKGN